MKPILLAGAVTLALGSALGPGVARAEIALDLLIENKTTRQSGTSITAAPGDMVKFTLTVRNLSSAKVTADVNVVAGIPGCMIDQTVSTKLSGNQKRKETVSGRVPAGHGGQTVTVDVSALASDGSAAAVNGSVGLTVAKMTSGSATVGPLQRFFLEMVVRGLVSALTGDGATASVTLTEIKALYR